MDILRLNLPACIPATAQMHETSTRPYHAEPETTDNGECSEAYLEDLCAATETLLQSIQLDVTAMLEIETGIWPAALFESISNLLQDPTLFESPQKYRDFGKRISQHLKHLKSLHKARTTWLDALETLEQSKAVNVVLRSVRETMPSLVDSPWIYLSMARTRSLKPGEVADAMKSHAKLPVLTQDLPQGVIAILDFWIERNEEAISEITTYTNDVAILETQRASPQNVFPLQGISTPSFAVKAEFVSILPSSQLVKPGHRMQTCEPTAVLAAQLSKGEDGRGGYDVPWSYGFRHVRLSTAMTIHAYHALWRTHIWRPDQL